MVKVQEEEEDAEEMNDAIRAGKVSVVFNLVFSILKGVAGLLAGSIALLADALHSLVDVLGSLLVWMGIKIASKPADDEHPYGHFKAESLAELGVGIIILLSSFLIVKEAIDGFLNVSIPAVEYYAVAVALLSAFGNELLARYKISVGKRTKSSALIAEGKHSRTDVLSSLSVVAGFIFVKIGYWWADPVVALAISVLIIQMGIKILKNSADTLMDKTDKELSEQISKIIEGIEGVESVNMVATRGTWKNKIVDVEFDVKPWIPSEAIKKAQDKVISSVKSMFPEVSSVNPIIRFAMGKYRIAIPSEGDRYTGDFGSQHYTIFDVNREVISHRKIDNPHYNAEKRKGYLIAELLKNEGVDVVVVNKIGEGGEGHLRGRGISVERISGNSVSEVVNEFVKKVKKRGVGNNIDSVRELDD